MFTLEIDGVAIAVINGSEEVARDLFTCDGFKDDIQAMKSDGKVLWNGTSPLKIRAATEEETEIFEDALAVLEQVHTKLSFLTGEVRDLEDAPQAYKDFEARKVGKVCFKITKSALTLNAKVDGISKDEFEAIAADAKANCPVSKVLNAEITLEHILAA